MSGVDEMYMENLDEWIFEENKVLWRHRSLVVTFEDIVNKSANGLGVSKSGNRLQGENPPVCI